MKLILAIISGDDEKKVAEALVKQNFFVTKLSSTGGFLRAKSSTFLIGTEANDVDEILSIIKIHSKTRNKPIPQSLVKEFNMFKNMPAEVKIGGATVFVLDVENFVKL